MELALGSTTQGLPNHDCSGQFALQLRVLEALLATGLQREPSDESLAVSQHQLDRSQEVEPLQVEIPDHFAASSTPRDADPRSFRFRIPREVALQTHRRLPEPLRGRRRQGCQDEEQGNRTLQGSSKGVAEIGEEEEEEDELKPSRFVHTFRQNSRKPNLEDHNVTTAEPAYIRLQGNKNYCKRSLL